MSWILCATLARFRNRNCVPSGYRQLSGRSPNIVIYSGKVHAVDLSRTDLSQTVTDSATFTLVVDKIDLAGIQLSGANLNKASFRNSRLRGLGADGRWDTADDWIADLSDAQMKEASSGADLSRVLMNRTNLIRATLNQANLSGAGLSGAI